MPAQLDDPTSPVIYRRSGDPPYPDAQASLPPEIAPREVTLRDRVTVATLLPFTSPTQVPPKLLQYLCDTLSKEIEKGDTYPMLEPMPLETFGKYWFAVFGAVMVMGDIQKVEDMISGGSECNWEKACLGSFYVKPNYPGRSSHVCNAGFIVTDAARNRGVGRLMGEAYLAWAPKLGYKYSVFNLVYDTNVASCRIWDALGFKRIGRVPGCGNLKSFPDRLVDAIIYGRELGGDEEDHGTEDRFDKIRYYLKNGQYPNGADRAEKSRLRSAATNYRLVPSENGLDDEKLMLKDKEVISNPDEQYEIARKCHVLNHGGINKTTASIAEKYHWTRIKDTVSLVIRHCPECKEVSKAPPVVDTDRSLFNSNDTAQGYAGVSAAGRSLNGCYMMSNGSINEEASFAAPANDDIDDTEAASGPSDDARNDERIPVDPRLAHSMLSEGQNTSFPPYPSAQNVFVAESSPDPLDRLSIESLLNANDHAIDTTMIDLGGGDSVDQSSRSVGHTFTKVT
ncbi:MAG: hypothetical protein M1831_006179 [Alyxoria varia]|nr:MAG: hypothetical protein M1831_006179 [Alyxoria varia]